MLTAHTLTKAGPARCAGADGADLEAAGARWIDLLSPTSQEEDAAERFLGVAIPTREEAQEIEFSSRLYLEDGGLFMTVSVVAGVDAGQPALTPLTFVFSRGRLATVRYADFVAFRQFMSRAGKPESGSTDPAGVFLALSEAIIDRVADVTERISADLDRINTGVFSTRATRRRNRKLEAAIGDIGFQGDIVSKVRESLASMERMLQFASAIKGDYFPDKGQDGRLKLMARDVRSLADQLAFLSSKVFFLLDATLGLISVNQNEVIRLLTVVATIFFPPTLIGTVYGMNFDVMPETHWTFGYPAALVLMAVTAVAPLVYFRWRRWF